MATNIAEPLPHALFEHVGELDDAKHPGGLTDPLADHQRGAAGAGDAVDELAGLRRDRAVLAHPGDHRAGRALAHLPATVRCGQVHTGHPGLRGERHDPGVPQLTLAALAQAVRLLGEHDDRAALGRLVGQAGQLRCVSQLPLRDTGQR
jgi:hypothetical protein